MVIPFISLFVTLCAKLDPDTHKGMHSVLALKLGVTEVLIRAVFTVGCKPRVDWTFIRAYSLQNYFPKSFSFILVFVLLILFKLLSYSLLFPAFRWFVPAAQPARALDISQLVRLRQAMCHPSRSCSMSLLSTFLRRRIASRSWSQYMWEKAFKKLNIYHRRMTTTMTMRMKKKKAMRLKVKMMKTTLL
jgi:hypothetical protein